MTPSEYKIKQYSLDKGGYVYVAFYNDIGTWWSIKIDGTTSISEEFVSASKSSSDILLPSIEKAGEAVNKHSTNGNSEVVWVR
jgi:hypothetical protein